MKKLVVITGAGSGFGKSLAKEFNKDGYPLLLIDKSASKLSELNYDNSICEEVDVVDYNSFEKAIRKAEGIYGKTDLLINNAGLMLLGNLENQNRDEWEKMLDVNIIGVMNGMQIVTNDMKSRQCGTIVNL